MSIHNFFLMNIFNITKLTAEELGILTHDLPSIHNIPFWNVSQMLKSIDKNYPFFYQLIAMCYSPLEALL